MGYTLPESDHYIARRALYVVRGGAAFPIRMIVADGGALQRYPREGFQTDEYLEERMTGDLLGDEWESGEQKRNCSLLSFY